MANPYQTEIQTDKTQKRRIPKMTTKKPPLHLLHAPRQLQIGEQRVHGPPLLLPKSGEESSR
jgi:hypothetical protein